LPSLKKPGQGKPQKWPGRGRRVPLSGRLDGPAARPPPRPGRPAAHLPAPPWLHSSGKGV